MFSCSLPRFFLPSSLASWVPDLLHPNLLWWVHHFPPLPGSSRHTVSHSGFWCVAFQKTAVVPTLLAAGLCLQLLPRMSRARGDWVSPALNKPGRTYSPQLRCLWLPRRLCPQWLRVLLPGQQPPTSARDGLASLNWESVPWKLQER